MNTAITERTIQLLTSIHYPNNNSTYEVLTYPFPVIKKVDRLVFYPPVGVPYSLKIKYLTRQDIRDMVTDIMRASSVQ